MSAPSTPATFRPIEVIGPIRRSGSSVYLSTNLLDPVADLPGSWPVMSRTRSSRSSTMPGTSSTNSFVWSTNGGISR